MQFEYKRYKVRCYFQSTMFYNYTTDYVSSGASEYEALVDVLMYVLSSIPNDEVLTDFGVYEDNECDFL